MWRENPKRSRADISPERLSVWVFLGNMPSESLELELGVLSSFPSFFIDVINPL